MRVHVQSLVADHLTPVAAYAALRRAHPGPSFLLESVVSGERWGRYSILGYRPRRDVVVRGERGADPFASLAEKLASKHPVAADDVATRFAQAHVGYVSYDATAYAHPIEPWPVAEPVARFLGEATVVVFDNLKQTVTLAGTSANDLEQARADLERATSLSRLALPDPTALPDGIVTPVDDARFEDGVRRVQEYVRAGDAFQAVLARPFHVDAEGADAFDAYRALRVLSPSPYMFFLDLPETADAPAVVQVAGASPETLVGLEEGAITLRPIAGTRRRGRTPEEDEELARELLADPKERAEHVMINLARNDVGRVARTGSVEVVSRAQIERFSHVMHIVSEVRGKLREGCTSWDVVGAAFPAGTLSGAPKVRAMQIVRELETGPRGIYGGAVGYVGAHGDLDLAIAIRTIVHRQGRFEVTAGAGVVEGSVPALEAKETRNKARAALAAIRAARGR